VLTETPVADTPTKPGSPLASGSGPTPSPGRMSQDRAEQAADAFSNIFIGIAGMIGAGK
jgi:hypothetical protein